MWWHNLLGEGVCATIADLARRERVNRGYMSRVLRLTLLAPDLVEAILDGRQPSGLRLDDLAAWVSAGVEAAGGTLVFALHRATHGHV